MLTKRKLFGIDHEGNVSGSELEIVVSHALHFHYAHLSESANKDNLAWILLNVSKMFTLKTSESGLLRIFSAADCAHRKRGCLRCEFQTNVLI